MSLPELCFLHLPLIEALPSTSCSSMIPGHIFHRRGGDFRLYKSAFYLSCTQCSRGALSTQKKEQHRCSKPSVGVARRRSLRTSSAQLLSTETSEAATERATAGGGDIGAPKLSSEDDSESQSTRSASGPLQGSKYCCLKSLPSVHCFNCLENRNDYYAASQQHSACFWS
jgi:hypothetical protein